MLVIAQKDLAVNDGRFDPGRLLLQTARAARQIVFQGWHLRSNGGRIKNDHIRVIAFAQQAAASQTPEGREVEGNLANRLFERERLAFAYPVAQQMRLDR